MVPATRRRCWIAAVVAVLGTSAYAARQDRPPQQPVFRSTVDLVQVDVVVVDKSGQRVRGLNAADFQLFDRKQPQVIAAFDEVSHAASTEEIPPALASVKKDVADNRSAQSQRLIILVVDDLHIYRGRTDIAKQLARDIVNKAGPDASMALLFTSGEHSTQVTEDRSELLAAVETLNARQTVRRPHDASDAQTAPHLDPEMSTATKLALLASVGSGHDFFDNMAQYKTLEDAARLIGTDTVRRKAFVLVSEGINKELTGVFGSLVTPGDLDSLLTSRSTSAGAPPASPTPYHDRALRDMMESLHRSNVTAYAIDPRGHVSSQDLARENFPSPAGMLATPEGTAADDDSPVRWNNPVRRAQDGLGLLAEASGGFAVTDTDDLAGGLGRVLDDLDHDYLLGFYPADPSGKDYRAIDVKVTGHPEWTLRFRKSYLPGGPPPMPKGADPLLAGVMPRTDLPLRLMATPFPAAASPTKTTRVVLALEITAPVTGLQQVDGSLQDDLTYQVVAIDEKKAKAASHEGHTAKLVLKPRAGAGAAPESVSYQIHTSIDLPPGRYQLRASAASARLKQGGSVYLTLDVPDFAAAPLSVSGLLIGYADGARVAVAPAPAPVGPSTQFATSRGRSAGPRAESLSLPFAPSLDREFLWSDTLRLYFEVVRTSLAAAHVTVETIDAQGRAAASLSRDIPASANSHVDLTMPLDSLAPGPYALRVSATNGRAAAQQAVVMRIR
jgi:VWFA-related protein